MKKTEMYSIITFIMVLVLSTCNLTACAVSNAVDSGGNSVNYADALDSLGLLLGTDNGYELASPVTRAQSAAMLVRFLGAQNEAQNGNYTHPFTDVPDWANKYVAYMYSNGLTRGVSATLFDPEGLCDLQMYSTLLLRALKHDEGTDFTFDTAVSKARELGIIKEVSESGNFLRGDMVTVSYFALGAKIKGGNGTLLDKLVVDGAVMADAAKPIQDLFAQQSGTGSDNTPADVSSEDDSKGITNINITINGLSFTAKLYDNDTTRALLAQFPMTFNISDLNGNEKYYYLTNKLPTDSQRVGSINAGELMLYGSDCLVLFYDSFSTSYNYTRLGYIDDAPSLATALGGGNIQVSFTMSDR